MSHKKDFVSERFGKEFNQNARTDPETVKQSTLISNSGDPIRPGKSKTNFFSAFAKENVSTKQTPMCRAVSDVPRNVAPKAAAILQIPLSRNDEQMTGNRLKAANDFDVRIEPKACELIANSKQFKLLNALSESDGRGEDGYGGDGGANSANERAALAKGLATVRRAPHRINNQPYCKLFSSLLLISIFRGTIGRRAEDDSINL